MPKEWLHSRRSAHRASPASSALITSALIEGRALAPFHSSVAFHGGSDRLSRHQIALRSAY
jgi:hypothetical protein